MSNWRSEPPTAAEVEVNQWWHIEYTGAGGKRRSRLVEFGVTETGMVCFDLGSLGIFEAQAGGDVRYALGYAPDVTERTVLDVAGALEVGRVERDAARKRGGG